MEIMPEEIRKLRYIFRPYCDGIYLREDAPQEAKDAYKKYHEWSAGEDEGFDRQ